ncbi:hypothetical protein CAEBREN_31536 [Caenorhabditis brenneri]|uniref:Uncharacterized protein n=1 Tax=Caenorhabditis brenneri TaxID=135651 RepID=G0N7Y2_CAEBE|nr:hypothetical protein CAEBREN_31536 [Caenorhabditis brenneri]
MPPGSSNFNKFGSPNLRSSAPTRRQTRSVYNSLPATSPRKSMDPPKPPSPRKKRLEQRQKRNSEKVEDVADDETEVLANQMSLVDAVDDNQQATSSSSQSAVPPPPPSKPIAKYRNPGRNVANPASEYYSRKAYRSVLNGEDMDQEKDEPQIDGAARQAQITDTWRQEYSLGTQELAHPDYLPKTVVVDDDFVLRPKEPYIPPTKLVYCDDQAAYYDSKYFEKEDSYDPAHYDITAHDTMWIKKLNELRPLANDQPYLTVETFVKIMKALEIDTFKNIHNNLLDALHAVYIRHEKEEDIEKTECDVCRVKDCNENDEMIFCDMCNTCMHMLCAGIIEVQKDKDFICQKCQITNNPAHPCVLCPALGGSMTYDSTKTKWAHHVCALFTPEVLFGDPELRAPITGLEQIPTFRYQQLCCICDTRQGACITCSTHGCNETYHVCCALRAGCSVQVVENGSSYTISHCHRHSPHGEQRGIVIDEEFRDEKNPWLAKLEARFYVMTNYEKLAESLGIEEIVVSDVYEFWKQKRLKKRGPLIPHLHDVIRIQPVIDRAAQKVALDLDKAYNKAGISVGSLPYCVLPRNYFFRPAALMVTELRQTYLKRADEIFTRDITMTAMCMDREVMKHDLIKANIDQIRIARKMMKANCDDPLLMRAVFPEVREDEIQKAMKSPRKRMFAAKLNAYTREPFELEFKKPTSTPSPIKRKCQPSSPPLPKEKSADPPLQKSPLRPRNHHNQLPASRNLSSGIQNSFAVPQVPPRNKKMQKL